MSHAEIGQVGLALLTMIVTPVASAFVVRYQIRCAQKTWLDQQRLIYRKEVFEKRSAMIDEAAGVFARAQNTQLNMQSYQFSRDLAEAVYGVLYGQNDPDASIYLANCDSYMAKAREEYLAYQEALVLAKKLAYSARVFFSDEVAKKIAVINSILMSQAGQPIVSAEHLRQQTAAGVSLGQSVSAIQTALGEEFNKARKDTFPSREAGEVLEAMHQRLQAE